MGWVVEIGRAKVFLLHLVIQAEPDLACTVLNQAMSSQSFAA